MRLGNPRRLMGLSTGRRSLWRAGLWSAFFRLWR